MRADTRLSSPVLAGAVRTVNTRPHVLQGWAETSATILVTAIVVLFVSVLAVLTGIS
jgi:hypothetical protein